MFPIVSMPSLLDRVRWIGIRRWSFADVACRENLPFDSLFWGEERKGWQSLQVQENEVWKENGILGSNPWGPSFHPAAASEESPIWFHCLILFSFPKVYVTLDFVLCFLFLPFTFFFPLILFPDSVLPLLNISVITSPPMFCESLSRPLKHRNKDLPVWIQNLVSTASSSNYMVETCETLHLLPLLSSIDQPLIAGKVSISTKVWVSVIIAGLFQMKTIMVKVITE